MRSDKTNERTVYVTKWGLTQGIRVYGPGQGDLDVDGKYFYGAHSYGDPAYCAVNARHWTYDRSEAIERVREMARRKAKSLQRQYSELRNLIDDSGESLTFVEMKGEPE